MELMPQYWSRQHCTKKMLDAMEELEDIAAYDQAKTRREESTLWVEARKELGLN
jgi:hypothetical protein